MTPEYIILAPRFNTLTLLYFSIGCNAYTIMLLEIGSRGPPVSFCQPYNIITCLQFIVFPHRAVMLQRFVLPRDQKGPSNSLRNSLRPLLQQLSYNSPTFCISTPGCNTHTPFGSGEGLRNLPSANLTAFRHL